MMGSGMGYTNGYNNGMGGDCCPMKKIWGSMNPKMDGMYVNVGKKSWGQLPGRCNSQCVYERKGAYDGLQYCFGDSMYSQSECDADMEDGEEPVDMGPGSGSGSMDMGSGEMSGSGDMSGSGGESPVDMGPGSGSGMGSEDPVDMGSGSGGEDPVDMGSGSGSEDPVDMGSGPGSEDPVNMGSGSGSEEMGSGSENMGSGSGSGSESSSGARCAPKVLMDKCAVDCNAPAKVDPLNLQTEFKFENGETTWKILADNPANKITLTGCAGFTGPQVTECKDGEWTLPKEISEICGGMMDHGSSSGSEEGGMMDHGSSSGSEEGGMMDHGSSSGSEEGGMMDHGGK